MYRARIQPQITSSGACLGSCTYFYPFFRKEIGCGVQDISRVCGVVIGVRRVIIGFNDLQPRPQSGFRAVEELADSKAGKHFETKINQRPGEKTIFFKAIALDSK